MIWYVGYGGKLKNGYFTRKEFEINQTADITNFLRQFDNTDVYQCMYRYAYVNKNKLLASDFYLDFDADINNEDDYTELKVHFIRVYAQILQDFKIKSENIAIYFSGNKGFHLIIPATAIGCCFEYGLNTMYKRLAEHYKRFSPFIDTRIYDDRRLFRLVNSVNSKSNCYKVSISLEQLQDFNLEEMKAYASQPKNIIQPTFCEYGRENRQRFDLIVAHTAEVVAQETKRFKSNYDPTYLENQVLLPCIEELLNSNHFKGERNQVLVILASSLFQYGCDYDQVEDYLMKWAREHFNPIPSDIEMKRTIRSAKSCVDNGKRFGCTAIIELGYCNGTCKYRYQRDVINEYGSNTKR